MEWESDTHQPWGRGDWLSLGALLVLSVLATAVLTRGANSLMYDSFRDMAWARAMLEGRWWQDAFLRGEPPWYPPGNPLIFALLAKLSGLSLTTLYCSSPLWWNAWIPVLFFALVRQNCSRATAWSAVGFLVFGSLWWLSHLAAPMPSIQAVLPGLLAVLCWLRAQVAWRAGSSGRGWIVACGALLALSFWVHPLCAAAAAAAVSGSVLELWLEQRELRRQVVKGYLAVAGSSLLLSLPVLAQQLANQAVASPTSRYLAHEFFNPDFALALYAPAVLPLAVLGLAQLLRRCRMGWALGMLVFGLAGQLPPLVQRLAGWRLPWLVPHEFQWHAQLAAAVCAAVGVLTLVLWLARRSEALQRVFARTALWGGVLTLGVVSPGFWFVPLARSYLMDLRPLRAQHAELVNWLRNSTEARAVVVCRRNEGYLIVGGLAGRRVVAVPPGFMNPRADVGGRQADLERLLEPADEGEFRRLADRYAARYLLVVIDDRAAAALAARALRFTCLETVFRSSDGTTVLFRVREG